MRILGILGLGLVAFGAATAGTLLPINLTTSTVGVGTCTAPCTPTLSFSTGTFENDMFTTVSNAPPPTPGPLPQNENTGLTPTPFILAQQVNLDDTYLSPNTVNLNSSLQVYLGGYNGTAATGKLGLSNTDAIYTMIQAGGSGTADYGFQGVTITLAGVAADGVTPVSDTILLTSGVDYRDSNTALPVTCTDANSNNPTNNIAIGCTNQSDPTASATGINNSPGGSGGNTVVTYNNVFPSNLNAGTNYFLDVQELELGNQFLGDYLDSITIASVAPSGEKQRILFSGLSADVNATASAPEPGTVILFVAGIGLLALSRIRRTRATRS